MTPTVTGVKPTGTPHLGNYLGMFRPALELAERHEARYFVADLHALTTTPEPEILRRHVLEVAATFLALGLDPGRGILYRQSDVPEVAILATILANVTPKGLLNRAHAYKAAVDENLAAARDPDAGVNVGLYTYPVLMAADILGPGAAVVPVGHDQRQHLEVTRAIARALNARYGEVLRIPEPVVDGEAGTVPGTDGVKMSKSRGNTIPVLGAPDEIRAAVMSIRTDSRPPDVPKDPGDDRVFALYRLVASGTEVEAMRSAYLAGGLGYAEAKRRLADALITLFTHPRERYLAYLDDPDGIEEVLRAGAERARVLVAETLERVRAATGLR